ncbi:branched-chain amino acid ABC transporter permease [Microbacterium sp. LWH7-1.2]|uniref:branched-chain amino acid ABC transporter permease n=1 Tax=Microbacterium sp. LWH7-1.2 TaxID=3135257 RepID=UPI0031395F9A
MTVLFAGIAIGSLYAITAMLYNITIASSGIFSFATAQYLMAGTFVSLVVTQAGFSPLLAIPAGAVVGGLLGYLTELLAIRPLSDKTGWAALVTTVGFGVVVEGVVYAIWGGDPRTVPFFMPDSIIHIAGGTLTVVDVWLIGIAIILTAAGTWIQQRTRWGLMGRAVTSDQQAAASRGINVSRLTVNGFIIAGAIGGALGFVVAPKVSVVFSLGSTLVIFGFVALTIGGFGSYLGCWIGGLVVGLVQALTERYLGSSFPLLVLFVLLLAVLLFKPTGLFGDRRMRLV